MRDSPGHLKISLTRADGAPTIAALVVFEHRPNMWRTLAGTESRSGGPARRRKRWKVYDSIAIAGNGGWGTAVALVLAGKGLEE